MYPPIGKFVLWSQLALSELKRAMMSFFIMLRYQTFSGCYKVKKKQKKTQSFMTPRSTGNKENKYYLSRQDIQHIQSSKNQIDGVVIVSCKLSTKVKWPYSSA